jgi:uncharacterized membrane protein
MQRIKIPFTRPSFPALNRLTPDERAVVLKQFAGGQAAARLAPLVGLIFAASILLAIFSFPYDGWLGKLLGLLSIAFVVGSVIYYRVAAKRAISAIIAAGGK